MTEALLQAYLRRPYSMAVALTDAGEWRAEVPELPSCVAFAASRAEALALLETACAVWLETALENGLTIPEPRVVRAEPSGQMDHAKTP